MTHRAFNIGLWIIAALVLIGCSGSGGPPQRLSGTWMSTDGTLAGAFSASAVCLSLTQSGSAISGIMASSHTASCAGTTTAVSAVDGHQLSDGSVSLTYSVGGVGYTAGADLKSADSLSVGFPIPANGSFSDYIFAKQVTLR